VLPLSERVNNVSTILPQKEGLMNREFAVLFDMNGVIVDDMRYHLEAWQEFALRRKKVISAEEFDKMLAGRTNLETIQYIVSPDVSVEEAKKLSEEKEVLYREIYTPHLSLVNGLKELILDLKQHQVPMAVATAAPTENVNLVLDGLQIRELFNVVVDADQVKHGKPAPDIFLRAAEMLQVPPKCCLVFEDSLLGLKAAQAAGMVAIGITTSHTAEMLQPTVATAPDFSKIDLDYIKQILKV
jgi:beta-phosphoglucomutase